MDDTHVVLVIPCVVKPVECVVVVVLVDDEMIGFLLAVPVLVNRDAVGTGFLVVTNVVVLPGNSIQLIIKI